jgi:hypothetical protein
VPVLGVVVPFVLGYLLMGPLLRHPQIEAIFVGAAMVATSVGITARVLRDLGVIASAEARIILGAAVIDDILAMVILAVVPGLAATGSISPLEIALVAGQATLFTAFLALVGTGAMRRYGLGLGWLRMDSPPSRWRCWRCWGSRHSRRCSGWRRSSGRSWPGWSSPRPATTSNWNTRRCRSTSSSCPSSSC